MKQFVLGGLVAGWLFATAVVGASAAITPASCENGGGNFAPGQQVVCVGEGQTQNPATNPAGHAPPGQQP